MSSLVRLVCFAISDSHENFNLGEEGKSLGSYFCNAFNFPLVSESVLAQP
jgi:hypothetical protein